MKKDGVGQEVLEMDIKGMGGAGNGQVRRKKDWEWGRKQWDGDRRGGNGTKRDGIGQK